MEIDFCHNLSRFSGIGFICPIFASFRRLPTQSFKMGNDKGPALAALAFVSVRKKRNIYRLED